MIDRLAARHGIRVSRPEGNALVGLGRIGGEEVVLAKPLLVHEFERRSGEGAAQQYGLEPARLLVVYDELDLPWGGMKLRPRGSAAGHNGVASIIGSLHTDELWRLRLGIHPGRPFGSGASYVLRPFRKDELDELELILERAADVVELYLAEGAEKAMAVANRRA